MTNHPSIGRNSEIVTGLFSLFSGIMLIFTILTRFEYITLFSGLNEEVEYLLDNLPLLRLNALIWVVSSLIVTITAAAFIALMHPFHQLFSWLTGFFLILSAAMISVSGIKALSVIDILQHYDQLKILSPEILQLSIYTLSREKEIYIITSFTLLGLAFMSIGLFAFRTRILSMFTAFAGTLTGAIIAVFTSLIPEGILSDFGLFAGSITFMVIGIRMLFSGVPELRKEENKQD